MGEKLNEYEKSWVLFGNAILETRGLKKVVTDSLNFRLLQQIDEVKEEAFKESVNLKTLTILNPKIEIGKFGFARCKNLTKIEVGTDTQKREEVSNWDSNITREIQLGDGCFGGCVNLNIENLPPNAGPFYRVHFEGLQCYADIGVTGVDERIKIDNWDYTAIPENKQHEILFYLVFLQQHH